MFSISASSSASASSRGRTSAGIASRPAICAARQRRSPATSSYVPPAFGRTSTGCSTPRSPSDPASACSAILVKARVAAASGWARSARPATRAAPPRAPLPPRPRPTGSPRDLDPSRLRLSHAQRPPWPARNMPPRPRCVDRDGSPAAHSSAPRPRARCAGSRSRTPDPGSARAPRARRLGPAACAQSCIVSSIPATVSRGFSSRCTSASVSSSPASPSRAKYSVCTGTITRSAATSALTVSGPSDGGQSSRMYSNCSLSGSRHSRRRCSNPSMRGSSTLAPASPAPAGSTCRPGTLPSV